MPWMRSVCLVGSIVGTPAWMRVKWRSLGVMVPARSCSGVSDVPVMSPTGARFGVKKGDRSPTAVVGAPGVFQGSSGAIGATGGGGLAAGAPAVFCCASLGRLCNRTPAPATAAPVMSDRRDSFLSDIIAPPFGASHLRSECRASDIIIAPPFGASHLRSECRASRHHYCSSLRRFAPSVGVPRIKTICSPLNQRRRLMTELGGATIAPARLLVRGMTRGAQPARCPFVS